MSIDPSTSGTLDFKQASKVTFVGSSSNTVIDTVTGSFGIGVDVNGPSSNLHVVGHTRLEGDINMLHTSNNAAIKLNSNVVTEFPRSKKLIKYPRVALTQNALNNGYTVIQSGMNGTEHRKAWTLFNNDVTTDDQYHAVPQSGETNPYNPSTGAYEPDVGFEDGLGDVAGEYVYVVMPDKIKLQGVSVHPRDGVLNRSAESARFMGSNDNGTTWVDLGGYSNYVWASGSQEAGNFFTVDSNEYYDYIGVVWTKVKGGSGGDTVNMAEVQFFGVPEYDPDAAGVDVKVTSYPNVPNTDWLEVYYDAKNYTSGTITDESPNNYVGTLNNVTFDNNAIQSFDIPDGGNISATLSSIPSADFVHTVSLWLKFEGDTLTTSYPYPFFMGNNSTYSGVGLYVAGTTDPNILHVSCWTLDFPIQYTFSEESWYHVTYTYKGGGWGKSTVKAYVNGIEYGLGVNRSTGTEGTVPTLPTSNVPFRIGTTTTGGSFDGKIANIRLFNRTLTSDEIWQLYAYQKEYFGHGDLSMTLKAGRLGIGTSEPRGALDVRGDVHVGGIITSNNPAFHVYRDDGDITTTDTTIVWNQVRFNRGNCYDSSTGVFHPPVDGMYFFSVFGMTDSRTNAACSFRFQYAPPTGSFDYIDALWPYQYVVASGSHIHASGSFVYFLETGSSFRVIFHGTELLARGNAHNGFSGFLIG